MSKCYKNQQHEYLKNFQRETSKTNSDILFDAQPVYFRLIFIELYTQRNANVTVTFINLTSTIVTTIDGCLRIPTLCYRNML